MSITAVAPVTTPHAATAASPVSATLPMAASNAVTGGGAGHGRGRGIDIKQLLLFAAAGAAAGMLLPVIPGGPLGGAAIGAALSFVI